MGQSKIREVLEVMADEYALAILTRTDQEPMSAKELTEVCDASETTIYRRIDRLRSLGFITEKLQIDRDGHHRKLYEATLEGLSIDVNDGDLSVDVKTTHDGVGGLFSDI